ncbi:MAG: hypothetical protein ABIG89_01445, partial [Candidatus Woesearchaeota archaeon]
KMAKKTFKEISKSNKTITLVIAVILIVGIFILAYTYMPKKGDIAGQAIGYSEWCEEKLEDIAAMCGKVVDGECGNPMTSKDDSSKCGMAQSLCMDLIESYTDNC